MFSGGGLGLLASTYDVSDQEEDEQEVKHEETKSRKRSSEATPKETDPLTAKKMKSLPVPDSLRKMFLAEEAALGPKDQDEPSKHQGRKRSFAHVRGNWAAHVYLDVDEGGGCLGPLANRVALRASEVLGDDEAHPVDSPHLSLSRTVTLRHHWIEPFAESLAKVAADGAAGVGEKVVFDKLSVLVNEEGTRTFVVASVMTVEVDEDVPLLDLVGSVDVALSEFGLPPFFSPPSFHVSLAWVLGDRKEELDKKLESLQEEFTEHFEGRERTFSARELKCKIGNRVHSFPFRRRHT